MSIRIPQAIVPPQAVPLPTSEAPPANPYGAPPNVMAQSTAAPAPSMAPSPYGQLSPPSMMGQNAFGLRSDITIGQLADQLLPKFRNVESSNNYKATNKKSSASGAYQYIDSTWGKYKGYPRAMDAPPEIQDARMREDLLGNLQRYGGDPFKAIAHHYYPAYAENLNKWDEKPVDRYGKEIKGSETLRDYVGKVIGPERVEAYLRQHRRG